MHAQTRNVHPVHCPILVCHLPRCLNIFLTSDDVAKAIPHILQGCIAFWTCTCIAVWRVQLQQSAVITYACVCRRRGPAPVHAGGRREHSATVWPTRSARLVSHRNAIPITCLCSLQQHGLQGRTQQGRDMLGRCETFSVNQSQ